MYAGYAEGRSAARTSMRKKAFAEYIALVGASRAHTKNSKNWMGEVFSDFIYSMLGWKILAHASVDNNDVYVVQKKRERVLVYDHAIHSLLRNNSIYTHYYWDYFLPLAALHRRPQILMIGLGGGTTPFQLSKLFKPARIDVVEISDKIAKISKIFLQEKIRRMRVIIGDGHAYLTGKNSAYDLIIMDPYIGEHMEDGFFSDSFLSCVRRALKTDGTLAINYAFTLRNLVKKSNYEKKLKSVFWLYSISYKSSRGNRIYICSKRLSREEMLERIEANFPLSEENSFIIKAYAKMKQL